MGNTELVLSTHRDVINPSCIQCKSLYFPAFKSPIKIWIAKMHIHFFDDKDPLQCHISPSSWFFRFTLTWKGSLEPTRSSGILNVSFFFFFFNDRYSFTFRGLIFTVFVKRFTVPSWMNKGTVIDALCGSTKTVLVKLRVRGSFGVLLEGNW